MRLEISGAPETVTDCNCSICRRLGAQWAYFTLDQVKIEAAPQATKPYAWGDRMIAFHHCRVCGCATHWLSLDQAREDRMAVNARLFDPADLAGVRVRRLDGAATWTYLDEDPQDEA